MTLNTCRPTFRMRVAALLIDYAIIFGWMAVLAGATLVSVAVTGRVFDWLSLGTAGAQVLGFVLLVLPVGLYLYVCEASERQATIGKKLLHLRVVSASDGARPARGRILLRTIVKLLPWEVAHVAVWNIASLTVEDDDFPVWLLSTVIVANALPIVYVLLVAAQRDRRGPHDLVSGTRVVTEN